MKRVKHRNGIKLEEAMDKCWLKAIFVVARKCCKDRKHPTSLFVIENASFTVCCE